jgi:hypothetical protein
MKKSDSSLKDQNNPATLAQPPLATKPGKVPSNTWNSAKLRHELEVHQIELEMQNQQLQIHQMELENQNDALRKAQTELDSALQRYTHLYDFGGADSPS